LMDVYDMLRTVSGSARVLAPGGRLAVCQFLLFRAVKP